MRGLIPQVSIKIYNGFLRKSSKIVCFLMKNAKKKFSLILRKLLSDRGIKQAVIAREVGVTPQTMNAYLKGSFPEPNTLIKIADYFDVTLDFLLKGRDQDDYLNVPVLGQVPAGPFSEAIEVKLGEIPVPNELLPTGDIFALKIMGDSMCVNGLMEGSFGIFRHQNKVNSGEIAAVIFEDEGTVKRVRLFEDFIILEPGNPAYPSILIPQNDARRVLISGKLILAITQY